MQFAKVARGALLGLVLPGLMLAGTTSTVEARSCKRINKTEGAILGTVAGGVIGKVVAGGTGGVLLGAVAGGVAGHEIARHKYNRYCGRRG